MEIVHVYSDTEINEMTPEELKRAFQEAHVIRERIRDLLRILDNRKAYLNAEYFVACSVTDNGSTEWRVLAIAAGITTRICEGYSFALDRNTKKPLLIVHREMRNISIPLSNSPLYFNDGPDFEDSDEKNSEVEWGFHLFTTEELAKEFIRRDNEALISV